MKSRIKCVTGVLTLALLVVIAAAAVPAGAQAAFQVLVPVGSDAAFENVSEAAAFAIALDGDLLPGGTQVDAVCWTDNILVVELTLPVSAMNWVPSPLGIERLQDMLAQSFKADCAFGGLVIRARYADDLDYRPLSDLQAPPAPVPADYVPDERPLPLGDAAHGEPLRGPVSQAARQPIGALTGVTVYTSAGHGWTADNITNGGYHDNAWYLQRPETHEMIEDYGNIDQLNYFVHYLFNAGATVVPLRPTGWQPIEIVLDEDDPGVTFTGTWSDSTGTKYYENGVTVDGVSYKWVSANAVETATARYTPTITVTDFYPVYCFAVASDNRALQTYRVGHSGGVSAVMVDHRETGSGWIWLGDYYLEAGGDNYVEITNESTVSGAIIADAIRWGCGVGDVVRPGPGTVSGYPRDEECQRYWAESELGDNAVGFSSGIWDLGGYDDGSDNVGAGARLAREMNVVPAGGVLADRWKRVHLEFHTNASTGAARGQICLITTSGATTYQTDFAVTLSDEVDDDLSLIDSEFEHMWIDRVSPTYTSAFGAISTGNNSDEFDATIVELAFHDNQEDAELLRDPRMRSAMARACVHGIIRFLNGLPGSQVPLDFPPDTPRYVAAADLGGSDIQISWEPPLADGARGDAATGYVVYESSNGYGFGNPTVVGNVTSVVLSGVPVGETRYYRVAATNAGGESMPSQVLAVRRPATGVAPILIVNGFDRLRRQISPTQTFTQPPNYAGITFERQQWRRSNSFDYVVQHAEALAANDYGFVSCSNEAARDLVVALDDYDIAVWILGTESTDHSTFDGTEQFRVDEFLSTGGALFVSGAEIGWDLVAQGGGASFLQDTLQCGYSADDAGTYDVSPTAGGIFNGLAAFDFDPANGAPYDTRSPDVLAATADSDVCLTYSGGGAAGVEFTGQFYNTVTFGFPFEAITDAGARADIMGRVIDFLYSAAGPLPYNYVDDDYLNMQDFTYISVCWQGPDVTYLPGHLCIDVAGEMDLDIDVEDFRLFQERFTGGP